MIFKLITGQPGNGKTLGAIEEVLKEMKIDYKGRTFEEIQKQVQAFDKFSVVTCGIEGLKEGLFEVMDDPLDWQDYPDGTLFLIDEAWKWFGSHIKRVKDKDGNELKDSNGKPFGLDQDIRFLSLAEHRHRGFRFIMTCQQTSQMNSFIFGLVSEHMHVARKFGTTLSMRYRWPSVCKTVSSQSQRALAQSEEWIQPKSVYELYNSATIHNIKRKIPFKVIMIPVGIFSALALIIFGIFSLTALGDEPKNKAAEAQADKAVFSESKSQQPVLTTDDYLAQFKPRISSQPWSAPAYDDKEIENIPRVFCMSTVNTCNCVTEQGTQWQLEVTTCRTLARWGQYEPLLKQEKNNKAPPPEMQEAKREFGFNGTGSKGSPEHVGQPFGTAAGGLKY